LNPTIQDLSVDLTGNPSRPPKVPGGGPACSWGPPRVAGGITFKLTPPDFDVNKAKATSFDIPPPVGKKDKGNKKIWQVWCVFLDVLYILEGHGQYGYDVYFGFLLCILEGYGQHGFQDVLT
jgi:hypothetical protein